MALLQTHFKSHRLGMQCTMNVILPQQTNPKPLPVLWLLHGRSDDHSTWCRQTNIELYAAAYQVAVIMPAAHRSFYTDMRAGLPYERFMVEELPKIARGLFHLSEQRQDNFIAGLSMGGYGAFKLALKYPQHYAAAASFSGVVDIAARWRRTTERIADMDLVYGDDPSGSADDLFHLTRQLAQSEGPRPRLLQTCGTEDFLYQDNLTFRDHIQKLDFDFTYREGSGNHNWRYWDAMIQVALVWFDLPRST